MNGAPRVLLPPDAADTGRHSASQIGSAPVFASWQHDRSRIDSSTSGRGTSAGLWRFRLNRHRDFTGISGIGIVACGVAFADGSAVMRWCSTKPSTIFYDDWRHIEDIHGHDKSTVLEWIDQPTG